MLITFNFYKVPGFFSNLVIIGNKLYTMLHTYIYIYYINPKQNLMN